MTDTVTNKIGDVANGHVWTGASWEPVAYPGTPPGSGPVPPNGPAKPWYKKWWGITGITVGSLLVLGSVFGGGAEDTKNDSATVPTPSASSAPQSETNPAPPAPIAEPEATNESPNSAYPASEQQFVSQVETSRTKIENAATDLQESAALRERDTALRNILGGSMQAQQWVGVITDVGANGEGKAYVEIEIADGVRVTTWNNALSDAGDNTLIDPGTTIFNNLLSMEKGTKVVFDATFFRGNDTALRGTNMTETFYGVDPKFLVRFSEVRAL